jgi:hypothetical protein
VKSTVSDSFFLSHRPSIIVGERSDYSNSEIMKQWLKRKDRTPGLLLIIGGAFVFLHVFFVLARLIIPDCEPPEFSVAS